ncbi:hypothetical protein D9756_011620 [Leucocoprinus leucothites]|uniref:Uncharacterized protein n=1 Tax=Leucocoprinus leucothites TaxID=201217 RepID=A0A8H5FPG7_9AGAR|nr:hypothetical protein D9756_011620 [Leucoagaricus leucothites]
MFHSTFLRQHPHSRTATETEGSRLHTSASALIKLYHMDGAPWSWPTWQETTGMTHGLFPEDDNYLPKGWTRRNATDVASYFRAYNQLTREDQKIQFAKNNKKNTHKPGRVAWNSFVSRNWNSWGIHNIVVAELHAWDVHPMSILVRKNSVGVSAPWPNAELYTVKIVDSLAMKLFGEDVFPDESDVLLDDEIRRCLMIIIQRSWNTIRCQVSALRNRADEIEEAAASAIEDLENNRPTKALVNKAIRAVAKWKDCAELLSTDQNTFMGGLGEKIKKEKKAMSKGKASSKALAQLATEQDVDDLLLVYTEYFETNAEEDDDPPLSNSSRVEEIRQLNDDEHDFGMEVEISMPASVLGTRLGFKSCLPAQFNLHRHRSGLSPWDSEELFKSDPTPPELVAMSLHWHQLAGVHSIARSIFTEQPDPDHTLGVLVTDEVGLGKTTQSLTFSAFLNQSIFVQENPEFSPAPILDLIQISAARPFLGDRRRIPSHPHLIVCPGTLIPQWIAEIKTVFIPHSVDILVYDNRANSATFWGPKGPVQTSNQAPHNRIIIASHSSVFTDFKNTHKKPARGRNTRPWDIPETRKSTVFDRTIFGQQFLSVTIDEAHHMRNVGNKHTAMLCLLDAAIIRIIMTATPLHTSPKASILFFYHLFTLDIASLARLVGIKHFSTEISYVEEKADASAIRKAKKLDDDNAAVFAENLQIVKRLQGYCTGHLLRRTTASCDSEGKTLIPLPPYKEIFGVLNLTERENQIIEERAEAAKAESVAIKHSGHELRLTPCAAYWEHLPRRYRRRRVMRDYDFLFLTIIKKFYLEYRLAVGYAKDDPSESLPVVASLDEWEPIRSTKMDVCARLCRHYLTNDDVEDVHFEEGEPIFPDIPSIPRHKISRKRRIIIYAEFPSMAPLLQNILRLHGVPSLAINGKISFQERDKRVKRFHDLKSDTRVLIFSSVGSAGLNLSIADVVIFFDQPWSAQDERQIRGRAHRQPQSKEVKVIYLLANNSADLLMNGVARGKQDMLEAFVNKELREGICRRVQALDQLQILLSGDIPDTEKDNEDLDDEPDDSTNESRKKKPKLKPKPKPATKPTTGKTDDEPHENAEAHPITSGMNTRHANRQKNNPTEDFKGEESAQGTKNKRKTRKFDGKDAGSAQGSRDARQNKTTQRSRKIVVDEPTESADAPREIHEDIDPLSDAAVSESNISAASSMNPYARSSTSEPELDFDRAMNLNTSNKESPMETDDEVNHPSPSIQDEDLASMNCVVSAHPDDVTSDSELGCADVGYRADDDQYPNGSSQGDFSGPNEPPSPMSQVVARTRYQVDLVSTFVPSVAVRSSRSNRSAFDAGRRQGNAAQGPRSMVSGHSQGRGIVDQQSLPRELGGKRFLHEDGHIPISIAQDVHKQPMDALQALPDDLPVLFRLKGVRVKFYISYTTLTVQSHPGHSDGLLLPGFNTPCQVPEPPVMLPRPLVPRATTPNLRGTSSHATRLGQIARSHSIGPGAHIHPRSQTPGSASSSSSERRIQPSRDPGPLSDLGVPPRSALKANRPSKTKK